MGILLLVVVVLVSLLLTVRAWRSYEAAARRNPGDRDSSDSIGEIPGEPFIDFRSSNDIAPTHLPHHGSPDCAMSHSGCDTGHGGFDGGHVGFGAGHH